jgi:hypothetical protein
VRSVRLLRVAAEAEGVRLRGFARRIVVRAVLGVIALLFLLGAIVFGHLEAWYGLRAGLGQTFPASVGILGGADLLVAVVLGFLATRSTPSRVEREALEVRRTAMEGIRGTVSLAAVVVPLLRIVADLRRRRRR